MFAYGPAGTGKTFSALYLALETILEKTTQYDNIVLFHSIVPTRDIGYLPGSLAEKIAPYEVAYQGIITQLLGDNAGYNRLTTSKQIQFMSTSFIRGMTIDNAIIIVDEMQNLSFHELDSIMTRVGENTRIVFCGDAMQSDLRNTNEKNGIHDFMRILELMPDDMEMIEMGLDDICRSGTVRNYLLAKHQAGF